MLARFFIIVALFTGFTSAAGAQIEIPGEIDAENQKTTPFGLVEEFTAGQLNSGEFKIGTELDYGLTDRIMIGTDIVSNIVGAPSIQTKFGVWESTSTQISLGLRAAYLTKKTLLWGSMNDHFDELDARAIRPSISWGKRISDRLTLHTFWAVGVGKVHATLSEKGRSKLQSQKNPAAKGDEVDGKKNQEAGGREESIITERSAQVQSITGLAQDRFQITGEFSRRSGHRVLISSRIERAEIEDLKTRTFRMTVAQHWIWNTFQFRLGGGFQYMEVSGLDLDGEKVDEAGWWPATDIAFYWRF